MGWEAWRRLENLRVLLWAMPIEFSRLVVFDLETGGLDPHSHPSVFASSKRSR